ncbi:unnamed protein product [Ectocarpus sp. 4 AP-2014]
MKDGQFSVLSSLLKLWLGGTRWHNSTIFEHFTKLLPKHVPTSLVLPPSLHPDIFLRQPTHKTPSQSPPPVQPVTMKDADIWSAVSKSLLELALGTNQRHNSLGSVDSFLTLCTFSSRAFFLAHTAVPVFVPETCSTESTGLEDPPSWSTGGRVLMGCSRLLFCGQ